MSTIISMEPPTVRPITIKEKALVELAVTDRFAIFLQPLAKDTCFTGSLSQNCWKMEVTYDVDDCEEGEEASQTILIQSHTDEATNRIKELLGKYMGVGRDEMENMGWWTWNA